MGHVFAFKIWIKLKKKKSWPKVNSSLMLIYEGGTATDKTGKNTNLSPVDVTLDIAFHVLT